MSSLDRVLAFLKSEADECPEPWMKESLEEINRMHKIAECFKAGDAILLQEIDDALISYFGGYYALHRSMIARLQAAAAFVEDSCK